MKNQARHSVSAPAQTYTLATARGLPWASDVPARCVTIKWLDAASKGLSCSVVTSDGETFTTLSDFIRR